MSHSRNTAALRRPALLAFALFTSLLSCGREITGPTGRGVANVAFAPDFSSMIDEVDGVAHSVAALVPFNRVRIELRRADNTVAAARIVDFPETATEVPLSVTVELSEAADRNGEMLTAFLRYINAAGDTVFAGGPLSVLAVPGASGSGQPVEIPVAPTLPGAVFNRMDISPDSVRATTGQTINFTAQGFDAQNVVVPGAIIGFISRNPAIVTVPNLGSGTVTVQNQRGSTWIIAQSLTFVRDSAFVMVTPPPSSITKVSGDAQTALTSAPFAQPLRVRLLAADNLPVAKVPVSFAVTSGGGSLSQVLDTTDANGDAEVLWTAGAAAGAASVTASTASPALSAVFTATQASAGATSLIFQTQPANITAGDTLPTIRVAVRNGLDQVITGFTGAVTLGLTGGTATAALVGTTTVNAVDGIASFPGITVNRSGTDYRLVATLALLTPPQSNLFNVAAAPPTTITVLGGAGQLAPPSTELSDSIRVRVTDQFGFAVVGAPVQFTLPQGGGAVSAATVNTDADGRASVRWTLGAGGVQQLRASVGALEQFVTATIFVSGAVELFAGVDYTSVRVAGAKALPIYLTNPSAAPVSVTLSVAPAGAGIVEWAQPTALFAAGQTRFDVPLNGLAVGNAWVYMNSSAGDDSVLVTVDSSGLSFATLEAGSHLVGDTIRTHVRISDPAPAGGMYVTVRSLNPVAAVVAPSSGSGVPAAACFGSFCYSNLVDGAPGEAGTTTLPPLNILAPPGDSALVFIPEGQIFGEFVVIALDDGLGCASVEITASAPNFAGSSLFLAVVSTDLYPSYEGINPATGMGVGQEVPFRMNLSNQASRTLRVQLESSRPDRVTVDSVLVIATGGYYSNRGTLRAVGRDSAWIRYSLAGAVIDSLLVVGDSAAIRTTAPTTYLPELGAGTLEVQTGALMGGTFLRSAPLDVTLVSTDTLVVVVDRPAMKIYPGEAYATNGFRMVGPGIAQIILSAPGHKSDSITVQTYTPAVGTGFSHRVGVGLLRDIGVYLPLDAVRGGARSVTVQSLNPSVLSVLTPEIVFAPDNPNRQIRVRGEGVGITSVRVSGVGVSTTDIPVTVAATQVEMNSGGVMPADGITRTPFAYLWDGTTTAAPADTLQGVLRSTDPAVIEVLDSVVTFTPASYATTAGSYRPIAPGSAQLWLIVPGFDSVSANPFTVTPFELVVSGSPSVGKNLRQYITLYRDGPDTLVAPITIDHRGDGLVTLDPIPTQFAVGQSAIQIPMIGETVGDDTITFSIPGYASVSTVVTVDPVNIGYKPDGLDPFARLSGQFVRNSFREDTIFLSYFEVGKPMRIVVSSLDTTRAIVEQDTIKWEVGDIYGPQEFARLKYLTPGPVQISFTDAAGELPGDTVEFIVQPSDLFGSNYSDGDAFAIGMGQRTDPFELFVQRAAPSSDSMWVQLRSTNPTLVQVVDSVLIPADDFAAYFRVTAGDSTGSARIVASAPGYNPWFIDVLVTRAQFGFNANYVPVGARGSVEVWAADAITSTARSFTSPVAARFRAVESSLVDDTGGEFVMPADSTYLYLRSPLGVAPGPALLSIVDDRPAAFDSVLAALEEVFVVPSTIGSVQERLVLTPGLISAGNDFRFQRTQGHDSTWVHLSRVGARFGIGEAGVANDSLLILRDRPSWTPPVGQPFVYDGAYAEYSLRGLSMGKDTLVLSSPGFVPDSLPVSVEPGILALSVATNLRDVRVGDSLLVQIALRDAKGNPAMAAENITFNVTTDSTFTAPATVTAAVGVGFVQFWVRGELPNTSTISVTHPNFRTLALTLKAVNAP